MSAKLPCIKAKKLVKYLCNKRGFCVDRISGSHYQLRHLVTGQRVTIPVHRQELRRGTLKEIISVVGLRREELDEL